MKKIVLISGLLSVPVIALAVASWGGVPSHTPDPSRPGGGTATVSKSPDSAASASEEASVSGADVKNASAPAQPYAERQKPSTDGRKVTINNREYPLRTYKPLAVPNDPYASEWWVSNARLNQAWDTAPGTSQPVLAIIDSGFALNHEEFANRWYTNAGESGTVASEAASTLNCTGRSLALSAACNLIDDDSDGIIDNETGPATYENPSRLNCTAQARPLDKSCNRLDDDGNGYTDDTRGWDFINHDNSAQAGELNPVGTGTTHGTRVAGIAAATGNNAKGIAGVDWNAKILPIQALDDDSYGDTLSVGRSIYYAIDQGADVISISLGSGLPDAFVREAVQAALAKGIVVVAAAGNDGCDCIVYPANYPEVLAVGALSTTSQPAVFSSYGANLDILAPGSNMTSSNWQSDNQTSSYVSGINGTSFATPMIAGMLTRLKSQQPTATPAQLIAAVTESVNRLTLAPSIASDPYYGFGTLDAGKATGRMAVPKTGQISYAFTPISKGNVLRANAPAEPLSSGLVYACDSGTIGSTAVFELIKGESRFFTISRAENQQAIDMGYASVFLAYACLQQPHDTNTVMHAINVFHEFRNIYP